MKFVALLLGLILALPQLASAQTISGSGPSVAASPSARALCRMTGPSVSAPADVTEDVLATCTVPANSLGPNGYLLVSAFFSASGAGGNRTVRIRWSGAGGTPIHGYGAGATVTDIVAMTQTRNVGATNSQVNLGTVLTTGFGGAQSKTTVAVDTTAATTVVISCQKAVGTDVCTLDQYLVQLVADGT
jgi:hypothetical protein